MRLLAFLNGMLAMAVILLFAGFPQSPPGALSASFSRQAVRLAQPIGQWAAPALPDVPGSVRSHALPLDGNAIYAAHAVQANMVGTYRASPGLQQGVIRPGETWSFNQNWLLPISQMAYAYGVIGGGVCDVAALYVDAAVQSGLDVQFNDHLYALTPVDLHYAPDYANPVIWGTPGKRGGDDVVIINTTNQNWYYRASIDDGVYVVDAWFETD